MLLRRSSVQLYYSGYWKDNFQLQIGPLILLEQSIADRPILTHKIIINNHVTMHDCSNKINWLVYISLNFNQNQQEGVVLL